MAEYKGNSFKSKEKALKETKEKRIEKVVSNPVTVKKKGEFQRFVDRFVSRDVGSITDYIFEDVLVPSIKKAIDDIVSNGIHMLLYNGDKRTGTSSTVSKISYGGFFKNPIDMMTTAATPRTVNNGFQYDSIIFQNRGDAELVLSYMEDIIDKYGMVSVLDMYDLADCTTTNYAAQKYGWTDLHTASVQRIPEGYIIKLPRAVALN